MKFIPLLSLLICAFFIQESTMSVFGEKGHYKFYFEASSDEEILLEMGGTSMKVGGEHILLKRQINSDREIVYVSDSNNVVIKKNGNDKFSLQYFGKFGDKEISMKIVNYTNDIDRIRQNAFRMVNKEFKRIDNFDSFLLVFNKFKEDPITNYKSK